MLGFVMLWSGCAQSSSVAGDCGDERRRAREVARMISEEWPLRSTDYVTDLVEAVAFRLGAIERQRDDIVSFFHHSKVNRRLG